MLYQLSERLGVDPNYIFALTQNKKLKYVENVKYVIRDCIKQKQYEELYEIVKKRKTKIISSQKKINNFYYGMKQLLYLW